MTSKNLPTPAAVGPVLADITCPMGTVRVTIDPAASVARAEVRTDDATGPSADAVAKSRVSQDGQRLTITVPEVEGGAGGITQTVTTSRGGTRVTQIFGNITGSVTGVTIVNGQVITGGGSGTVSSGIEVLVTLPAGSGVRMNSRNADLVVTGVLAALDLDTHNGSLRAGIVGRAKVRGHNGDNDIQAVQEWADIETHNGNTYIGTYGGGAARLITHNGNVELSAAPSASGQIEARAHNGNVRLRGVSNRPELDVIAKTRNGHVSKN
ncbi:MULTISPECIES: DUF4097 family beta strand repeat-containing protein [Streptomyces]|uniref:hypothetical protein n=1 Tax=Streptomyces TaxID=1883 RepID=UPI00025CE10E|nr:MULTISPECIES: hypothetical protein [Streptomyces]EIF87903.1 hypothetical protein [Streptomyces tsukubensis NRRL18488]MYS66031.1 hypothetical protein [Streptomyces sp. SID5473]GGP93482.1 hypothetical protein GCM10010278_84410 [Streptomyces melanogenes]